MLEIQAFFKPQLAVCVNEHRIRIFLRMKKTLFMLALFMGSLMACTQSTNDEPDESLGPDHEEYPVGTGENTEDDVDTDTTRNNLNNQEVIE